MVKEIYQGWEIIIEEDTLVDWGYQIVGLPYHRDNWGYVSLDLAMERAKKIIDRICICR